MTGLIMTLEHHCCAAGRGQLENVQTNGMTRPSDGGATYEYNRSAFGEFFVVLLSSVCVCLISINVCLHAVYLGLVRGLSHCH